MQLGMARGAEKRKSKPSDLDNSTRASCRLGGKSTCPAFRQDTGRWHPQWMRPRYRIAGVCVERDFWIRAKVRASSSTSGSSLATGLRPDYCSRGSTRAIKADGRTLSTLQSLKSI